MPEHPPQVPTLHLMEGPVGAGKSTYAGRLALEQGLPQFNLDEWMVTLFRPDRPETNFMEWYGDRKQRCIEQIWLQACQLLEVGLSPILELGLVRLTDREDFYRRIDATDYPLQIHLLDAPKATRWQRVQERNEAQSGTFKMAVSSEIFEMANGAWEPFTEAEERERAVLVVPASGY